MITLLSEKDYEEVIFTERQWEVLELLKEGFTNDHIGEILFISRDAVKYHLRQMYLMFDLNLVQLDKYEKRLKLALIGAELFGPAFRNEEQEVNYEYTRNSDNENI